MRPVQCRWARDQERPQGSGQKTRVRKPSCSDRLDRVSPRILPESTYYKSKHVRSTTIPVSSPDVSPRRRTNSRSAASPVELRGRKWSGLSFDEKSLANRIVDQLADARGSRVCQITMKVTTTIPSSIRRTRKSIEIDILRMVSNRNRR